MSLEIILKLVAAVLPFIIKLAENGNLEQAATILRYTAATKDKVEAFQKAHGLTVDGIVGDETWSKVEELLKPH